MSYFGGGALLRPGSLAIQPKHVLGPASNANATVMAEILMLCGKKYVGVPVDIFLENRKLRLRLRDGSVDEFWIKKINLNKGDYNSGDVMVTLTSDGIHLRCRNSEIFKEINELILNENPNKRKLDADSSSSSSVSRPPKRPNESNYNSTSNLSGVSSSKPNMRLDFTTVQPKRTFGSHQSILSTTMQNPKSSIVVSRASNSLSASPLKHGSREPATSPPQHQSRQPVKDILSGSPNPSSFFGSAARESGSKRPTTFLNGNSGLNDESGTPEKGKGQANYAEDDDRVPSPYDFASSYQSTLSSPSADDKVIDEDVAIQQCEEITINRPMRDWLGKYGLNTTKVSKPVENRLQLNAHLGSFGGDLIDTTANNSFYGPSNCNARSEGFRNLGNTCYMGSALQAILSQPVVIRDFLSPFWRSVLSICEPADVPPYRSLLKEFVELTKWKQDRDRLRSLRSRAGSVVDIWSMKKLLDERTALFRGHGQQDAHEFLTELISALEEELKPYCKEALQLSRSSIASQPQHQQDVAMQSSILIKHLSPIERHFHTSLECCLTCSECNKSKDPQEEIHRLLSVDIPADELGTEYSLQRLLESKFKDEYREVLCENCKKNVNARYSTQLKTIPNVLVIHFKRFQYDFESNTSAKLATNISFPLKIDLMDTAVPLTSPLLFSTAQSMDLQTSRSGCYGAAEPDPDMDPISIVSDVCHRVHHPDVIADSSAKVAASFEPVKQIVTESPSNVNAASPELVRVKGGSSETAYHLTAVVQHLGSSSGSGHYVCDRLVSFASCGNDTSQQQLQWERCNDSTTTLISQEDVLAQRSNPYMLFYLRDNCQL